MWVERDILRDTSNDRTVCSRSVTKKEFNNGPLFMENVYEGSTYTCTYTCLILETRNDRPYTLPRRDTFYQIVKEFLIVS